MPKLLVIDDEIDLCDLIAEVADDAGMTVKTISDSSEVEAAVDEFKPDAIMMDLMMPGTDGVELLRVLAGKVGGAQIALMSGSDSRVLNSARRLGSAHGLNIVATLEKPLEIATIRQAIVTLSTPSGAAGASGAAAMPVTAANLSEALASGNMQVAVQPIVKMDDTLVGVEILPRWLQPDGTMLAAAEFVEKARDNGLLGNLMQDILETTLKNLAELPDGASIAINIDVEQLRDPYFATRVAEITARYNKPMGLLAFEVSEKQLAGELDAVLPAITDLKARGAKIWLNDYAGAMSLVDLMRMPLDGMKLSRELVLALPDATAQATIAGAQALATARQLPVYGVAVETSEQREVLGKLNVTGYQGHFLARPMKIEDFSGWLITR